MPIPYTVYHYTTLEKLGLIQQENKLICSSRGEHGRGVYLTDLTLHNLQSTLSDLLRVFDDKDREHIGSKLHSRVVIRTQALINAGYELEHVDKGQYIVRKQIHLDDMPRNAWWYEDLYS